MSKKQETSAPALKRSWFQELKAEFSKITWPSKDSLLKQSVLVTIASVIVGFLVAGVDFLLQIGIDWIVG